MDLSATSHDYLEWLERQGKSANTVRTYRGDLLAFDRYLQAKGASPDIDEAVKYVAKLKRSGLRESTVARATVTLRGLFSHLGYDEVTDLLKLPSAGKALGDAIPVQQVIKLLNSLPLDNALEVRNAAILELLYSCALRVNESMELAIDDVIFDKNCIQLHDDRRPRTIPFGAPAKAVLTKWLSPAGRSLLLKRSGVKTNSTALFLNANAAELTRQGVNHIVERAAIEFGGGRASSPFTLRDSCIRHMIDNGAPPELIRHMIGQRPGEPQMSLTKLRREYAKFHPRA